MKHSIPTDTFLLSSKESSATIMCVHSGKCRRPEEQGEGVNYNTSSHMNSWNAGTLQTDEQRKRT